MREIQTATSMKKTKEGWLVTETLVGVPLADGELRLAAMPQPPPQPVRLEEISLEMATEVCKTHGLYPVPIDYVTEAGQAVLFNGGTPKQPITSQEAIQPDQQKGAAPKLTAKEKIEQIKVIATEAELDALMEGEDRETVIAAAEARLQELKEKEQ